MSRSLLVFTPTVGTLSETFIRRHIEEVADDPALVVSSQPVPPGKVAWAPVGPSVVTARILPLYKRVLGRLGLIDAQRAVQAATRKWIGRHRPHAALGEYLDYSWLVLPFIRSTGIPFYPHAHGYDVSEKLRDPVWRERYLELNETSGIITMSRHSADRLIDLGISPNLLHVIPYGVDVPPQPPLRPLRPEGPLRLLMVGRFVPKKAPLNTIRAFAKARAEGANVELDCVGTGPLFAEARHLVNDEGLQSVCRLHGGLPHVQVLRMMGEVDVFLQHSIVCPTTGDMEGLPVGILEAMARGLAVVSTLHAGIPEEVSEGINGYLVPEGDVDGMADRILKLAHDPATLAAFGRASWERARDHFSWSLERQRLRNLMGLDPA